MQYKLCYRSRFFFHLSELVESDAYFLTYPSRLHRYPVQHIRYAHRPLGVSDYYKLRILLKFPQKQIETLIICLVQCSIYLIEETKRRRFGLENRKQKSNCDHRLFTSAKQRDTHRLFPRRPGDYLYRDRVPTWVRAFAREVVRRAKAGSFDPADYGIVHPPPTPTMIYLGIRYAVWAALTIGFIIASAHMVAGPSGCYFPPCY